MMKNRYLLSMALAAVGLCGCDRGGGNNAGLTNGPGPSVSREKSALRTDLPPSGTADRKGEALGEAGDLNKSGGTAAAGDATEQPRPERADPRSVRANPPAKGSTDPGPASGGTKPPDQIETGTPRSPH